MTPALLWFRRDLRLGDHPALLAAADAGPVVPVFVLDDELLGPSGAARQAFLLRSLRALDADLRQHGPGLVVRHGRPEDVVPALAAEVGATSVHISADFAPYGAARDERVAAALGGVPLVATGSPYAVAPGRLRTGAGQPYKVFTPFSKAWVDHGWRAPAASDPAAVDWVGAPSDPWPDEPDLGEIALPVAGEAAGLKRWRDFAGTPYDDIRDRPDLDETSRLSTYLRWGAIHPRTLLADLARQLNAGDHHAAVFRKELAWREFHAHVLHHWPATARDYFKPDLKGLPYVEGSDLDERLAAWAAGRTGYPIVDAGMRQLLAEGWMHNRVRMIVASFLVKDLHVEWTHGARHFMEHLVDGDLASNQHNWQWVAGCGTDAAPYFRIFNPTTQGKKFDPHGDYCRRWVPELDSAAYPAPIVDHAAQRAETLAAYQELRHLGG